MALKIAVVKNHLPNKASPYFIRSGTSDVVEFDRFVEIMAEGRTTLSQTDIVAAMQLYKEELQKQLSEGKTVKTPTAPSTSAPRGAWVLSTSPTSQRTRRTTTRSASTTRRRRTSSNPS